MNLEILIVNQQLLDTASTSKHLSNANTEGNLNEVFCSEDSNSDSDYEEIRELLFFCSQ
jgi:hypothetical protein